MADDSYWHRRSILSPDNGAVADAGLDLPLHHAFDVGDSDCIVG